MKAVLEEQDEVGLRSRESGTRERIGGGGSGGLSSDLEALSWEWLHIGGQAGVGGTECSEP